MSDMKLPEGASCGDCDHFARCSWLVSAEAEWTTCDFYPRRFMWANQGAAIKAAAEVVDL